MMNTLPVERHDEVLGAELCVLVFRHEGSPACAAFQPELDEFVRRRPLIAVWTVEAMQHQDVSERHNLRALPSVVVYREGMPCRRLAGAVSADDLAAIVDEVAAADMDQEYNDWMLGMLESGEAGSPHVGTPHPDASSSAAVDTAASELLVPMTSGTPAGSVFDDGPGPVESQSRDWGELYEEANDAWYAGDAPKALAGFTALLAMKPASTEILNYRGQVLADIGDGALAVRDLSRYLDVALDMWGIAYARSARALALAQTGRHEAADMDMAAALAVTPDSAWAYLRLARIHLLREEQAAANTALEKALQLGEPPLTDHQRELATSLLGLK